jgi:NAD dependent epimerase/dehydratase family enzyme
MGGRVRQTSAGVDRTVLLRIGVGLGGEGDPAAARLAQIGRLGLGGKIGSGRQWVSRIGLEDLLDVMIRAVDEPQMHGTYHATSPNLVTNAQMMRTYRRPLGAESGWRRRRSAHAWRPSHGKQREPGAHRPPGVPWCLIDEGFEFRQPPFDATARQALERSGAL